MAVKTFTDTQSLQKDRWATKPLIEGLLLMGESKAIDGVTGPR